MELREKLPASPPKTSGSLLSWANSAGAAERIKKRMKNFLILIFFPFPEHAGIASPYSYYSIYF
jgi:hypothetical protein